MIKTACTESIELSAGPLSMVFEPSTAMLRYVRFGDIEVVRGVFAPVRDQNWNTIPFTVHDFQHRQSSDQFSLDFLVKCSEADIQFDWRGEVKGTSAGIVRFEFRGEAKSICWKNRIGLCVLHPIKECAGRRCVIEHTDGSTSNDRFPKWISPHQPFKNIRSMTHDVATDLQAKVTFTGEVFETEDQRNWTDASYKTYCTPLELPFPIEISAGSQINQSVAIELCGDVPSKSSSMTNSKQVESSVHVTVNWEQPRPMLPIGLSMATCPEQPATAVKERLREIKPAHLRLDLNLGRDDWFDELHNTIEFASDIDSKLEVAIFTVDVGDAAWTRCLQELERVRDQIARWLVFHPTAKSTPDDLAEAASAILHRFSSLVPVIVGTNAYFAELNRNRPKVPGNCLVGYSINPQVHAFDELSLCETLQTHRWTVDTAQHLFGRPVVISPITLRPRFNPNATSNGAGGITSEPETDPRQSSAFVAAWTVGVLSQLASHPNVASLTFYETFGPRGIMSSGGEVYPVASVFDWIRGGCSIFQATSSAQLEVAAVALQRCNGDREVLLANMSNRPQQVGIGGADGGDSRFAMKPESVKFVNMDSPL